MLVVAVESVGRHYFQLRMTEAAGADVGNQDRGLCTVMVRCATGHAIAIRRARGGRGTGEWQGRATSDTRTEERLRAEEQKQQHRPCSSLSHCIRFYTAFS